ncbi:hypothetical protein HBI56_226800 [Parastagonospora nodorum]|nr:hypothetical protein HBH69_215420 [Parastagonospora nodorum]KAH5168943.1 hypothetical protein HBH77_233090 [Parastagonospora nodorum]KAH5624506.1 hypothetical protein HBI23_233320 [Parastagonospora nodorum]KAH6479145.1 hypothetical protein HBI56_226800 [Parastagonospora nodorum]
MVLANASSLSAAAFLTIRSALQRHTAHQLTPSLPARPRRVCRRASSALATFAFQSHYGDDHASPPTAPATPRHSFIAFSALAASPQDMPAPVSFAHPHSAVAP